MQDLLGLWIAALAHERLLPLISHRVSHPVRGVDRDYVGLHGGCRNWDVFSCLHVGHGHWKSSGESNNCMLSSDWRLKIESFSFFSDPSRRLWGKYLSMLRKNLRKFFCWSWRKKLFTLISQKIKTTSLILCMPPSCSQENFDPSVQDHLTSSPLWYETSDPLGSVGWCIVSMDQACYGTSHGCFEIFHVPQAAPEQFLLFDWTHCPTRGLDEWHVSEWHLFPRRLFQSNIYNLTEQPLNWLSCTNLLMQSLTQFSWWGFRVYNAFWRILSVCSMKTLPPDLFILASRNKAIQTITVRHHFSIIFND